MDRSFVDVLQNTFMDGEELDFTRIPMDPSCYVSPPTEPIDKVIIPSIISRQTKLLLKIQNLPMLEKLFLYILLEII